MALGDFPAKDVSILQQTSLTFIMPTETTEAIFPASGAMIGSVAFSIQLRLFLIFSTISPSDTSQRVSSTSDIDSPGEGILTSTIINAIFYS